MLFSYDIGFCLSSYFLQLLHAGSILRIRRAYLEKCSYEGSVLCSKTIYLYCKKRRDRKLGLE